MAIQILAKQFILEFSMNFMVLLKHGLILSFWGFYTMMMQWPDVQNH